MIDAGRHQAKDPLCTQPVAPPFVLKLASEFSHQQTICVLLWRGWQGCFRPGVSYRREHFSCEGIFRADLKQSIQASRSLSSIVEQEDHNSNNCN